MIRTPHHPNLSLQRKKRSRFILIQRYQKKYAWLMMKFGLVFGLFVVGIALYLLNNNYFLFKNTLLLYAPQAVKALNTELKFANELILTAFFIYVLFMGWLGLKISQKLVTPMMLIQEKIIRLCRGSLENSKIQIRRSDEFQDFCNSYNYLVDSMRAQIEIDLQRLNALKPEPKNKDALYVWEKMVEEKNLQLGNVNEKFFLPDQADVERPAS
jgi:hypothetical protein